MRSGNRSTDACRRAAASVSSRPELEVKLVAPNGEEADEGECWIRSPYVLREYVNLPELSRERIRDGWLRTGDILRRDADGFFYYVTRIDDMFVCGGENIYPKEVENLALKHPDVANVAVAPLTHDTKGFAPAAMVVLEGRAAHRGAGAAEFLRRERTGVRNPARHHVRRHDSAQWRRQGRPAADPADDGGAFRHAPEPGSGTLMNPDQIAPMLGPHLSQGAVRSLMVELAKVPSPQTELFEAEPLLRRFIETAVAPRVKAMGFKDIRFDDMGNLIATYGANRSGASLMLCSNAMNQPQATMKNAYSGDVIDGRPHGLPGEAVMGKGLSEQKATMAAMLHAMDAVIRSGVPIDGRLVFLCCVSGETGRHDAIRNVVETEGVRADMCILGGNGNRISLGNRGRIDVFITVRGAPSHSSRPHDGCNAITGAFEVHRRLLDEIKLTGVHPQLGRQTLTINHIRSFPESTHTIQDRCELVVDRRLLPEDDPQDAFKQIEAVAMRVDGMKDPASGKSWSVSVKLGPFMYPSLVTTQSAVVKAITEASLVMTGAAPETIYNPSAFDQGYLNHVGIECCNYGPGEHQFAHTDLDMASVDRAFAAAKVFAFLIVRRLGA